MPLKFGRSKKTPPSTKFMSREYGRQVRAEKAYNKMSEEYKQSQAEKAYKKQAQKTKRVTVVQGTQNGKPVAKEHWKKKKDGSWMVTHRTERVGKSNRWKRKDIPAYEKKYYK